MDLGNLILAAIPVLLALLGKFCAAKEQKAVFCLIFGAAVFFTAGIGGVTGAEASGYDGQRLVTLAALTENMAVSTVMGLSFPPAYTLILKICLTAGIGIRGFMLVIAALQGFLAAAFIYNRPGSPYAGAVVFAGCFLPAVYVGSNVLTAALICLFGAKYIEERRFFRFAAVMLAAACFDISAVLLIPVWFITVVPNNWAAMLISALLAASALLPGVTGAVYGFLGEGLYVPHETPIPAAVTAVAAALLFTLMTAMFRNRSEQTARLVPAFSCGAVFAAAGIFEPRLFGLSLMTLAMSAAVIAPDAHYIIRKFTLIVFPDNKKAAGAAVDAVCCLAVTALCVYFVLSDCFGSSYFGTMLFGEVA